MADETFARADDTREMCPTYQDGSLNQHTCVAPSADRIRSGASARSFQASSTGARPASDTDLTVAAAKGASMSQIPTVWATAKLQLWLRLQRPQQWPSTGSWHRPRTAPATKQHRLLLPILQLIWLLSAAAAAQQPMALAASQSQYEFTAATGRRMLLQAEAAPASPSPSPPSPQALPPPPESPALAGGDQPAAPLRPPAPAPPPPPSNVGIAGTSPDFFRLLYGISNITEIRLSKDITLQAADAAAAASAAVAAGTVVVGGEATAQAALGMGLRGPVLQRNVTIVGYSRGTHTRLDTNFLAGILRLKTGVRLTLRKVELFKALNQVDQVLDFVGKSSGGVVALEECVQRRAVCMPFVPAVAQLLTMPSPTELPAERPPRDVSLLNESSVCWSTSTLMPICKQPAINVESLSLHVPAREGALANTGGYDVSYTDTYIVCDNPINPACLNNSSTEQCFARELARRYGDGALPPPSGGSAAAAGQVGETPQGRNGGGGPSRVAVGLAAGLAGGGGALVFLAGIACVLILLGRRRRRHYKDAAAAAAAASDGKDGVRGGNGGAVGAASGEEGYDEEAAAAAAGADSGPKGAQQRQGSTASAAGRDGGGGDLDSPGTGESGGGGGGGADTGIAASPGGASTADGAGGSTVAAAPSVSNDKVLPVQLPAAAGPAGAGGGAAAATLAAAVAAAAASGRGRADPLDVESIRRSLMSAAQRHPEVPLQVQLLQLLGEGSFGKVYKAVWQGTVVALKVLVLSGSLTQDQRRRKMAVMEAAISSFMSHPNVVQTYTYSFRPIREVVTPDATSNDELRGSGNGGNASQEVSAAGAAVPPLAAAAGSPSRSRVYGHELLLVLEYCDRGSLRQALDAGLFHRYSSGAAAGGGGGDGDAPPALRPLASGNMPESAWLTPAAEFSTLTGPPPVSRRPQPCTGGGGGLAPIPSTTRLQYGEGQLSYNYSLMLQVACDVASALLHLHNHGVVHGDVKASNVLLKTAAHDDRRFLLPEAISLQEEEGSPDATAVIGPVGGGGGGGGAGMLAAALTAQAASTMQPAPSTSTTVASSASGATPSLVGVIAKVADFGLSTVLGFEGDTERTHITALTAQGSLTHMAPELMLHGHISKRVDVYAFGILLYELFTGDRAHRAVPRALLPYQVAICGLRPALPAHTPPDFRVLAEACWAADPTRRPTFEAIVAALERMRAAHAAATAAGRTNRIASFSTSTSASAGSASRGSAAAPFNAVQPDGWVLGVPSPRAPDPCSSTIVQELQREGREAERRGEGYGAGGDGACGGGAGGGRDAAAAGRAEAEDAPTVVAETYLAVAPPLTSAAPPAVEAPATAEHSGGGGEGGRGGGGDGGAAAVGWL